MLILVFVPRAALDYPPLFAYFSYLLTLPAKHLLPASTADTILKLSSTPIETWQTITYMRTTVLLSELFLAWGAFRYVCPMTNNVNSHSAVFFTA